MSGVLPVAKLAVHVISSVGVSKVVGDIVKNNTNVETTADAVKVLAGGIVIGSLVADVASKHVTARMDEAVAWYQNRKAVDTPAATK